MNRRALEFCRSRFCWHRGRRNVPLRVELKPFERIVIGQSVITNSETRAIFLIDGETPILREKDILTFETADSPAKRIYLAVQLMYINDNVDRLTQDYFALINDIVTAAPSTTPIVDEINNEILTGSLYKALKAAKKLIQYEQGLLRHAT